MTSCYTHRSVNYSPLRIFFRQKAIYTETGNQSTKSKKDTSEYSVLNGISTSHPYLQGSEMYAEERREGFFLKARDSGRLQGNGVFQIQQERCACELRDCDSMHKSHTSSNQTKSQRGGVDVGTKFYLHLKLLFKRKKASFL